MSVRPTSGRLGAAVLVMLCLTAIATPNADAATPPDATVGMAARPASSPSGLAGGLGNPTSSILDPLESLASDIGKKVLGILGGEVLGGAGAALQETATIIDQTTAPRLESTWFSSTYWRVVGLAAVLTLPFLFAAAVQALLRSDLTLLVRAAFGYLPLAMLGVSVAAPITLMLLSVTDEMCSVIAGAGSGGGAHFLRQTAGAIVGLSTLDGSPFLGFAIGLMTLGAAIALAVEMLIREAAVYIVVLMLPLAFAALVWPARRTWAVRLVELLISLILSKFVIVAVLSLAGAAYGATGVPSVTRLLTAMSLVLLSTFAPWVMLRLLPFTELAASAGGALRAELPRLSAVPRDALEAADSAMAWAEKLSQRLRPASSDKTAASGTEGSEAGGTQAARAGYAPANPDGEGISPLAGDSGRSRGQEETSERPDGRPGEPLPGISSFWQGPMGAVEVSLGRGGTGAADYNPQPTADGARPQAAGGTLAPDLARGLPPQDAGISGAGYTGISAADEAGISPAGPPDDEPPLPRSDTTDESRL